MNTSLTKRQLDALHGGNACAVALAHASLTRAQAVTLYGLFAANSAIAKLIACGRTIHRHNLSAYCQGIGQRKLRVIMQRGRARNWSREQYIEELLQCL